MHSPITRLIMVVLIVAIPAVGWPQECGIEFFNDRTRETKRATRPGGSHGYHDLGGKFQYIKRTWGVCSFHVGDRPVVPGQERNYHSSGGREATYGSGIMRLVPVGAKDRNSKGWSARVVRISQIPNSRCSIRLWNGNESQTFYGPGAGVAPFVSGWNEVVDVDGLNSCRFTVYTGDYYSGKSVEIRGKNWIDEGIRSIAIEAR